MTTELSINFTSEEKKFLNFNIHQLDIDPTTLDQAELPTDIHLVEYEVEGKLYVDAIRAFKMSDIFDGYYDKLNPLGGKITSITSGYGNLRPNLYNPKKSKG
jgi:hypothetical protein